MQKELIFVSRTAGVAKETNRPYDILTLSNGLRAGNVSFDSKLDTSSLKEGDHVKATFVVDLNYENRWTARLVELVKVK